MHNDGLGIHIVITIHDIGVPKRVHFTILSNSHFQFFHFVINFNEFLAILFDFLL